jgi:predicted O-methyltransferase YrrM
MIKSILKKILRKIPYIKFLEKEYQNSLLLSEELGHAPGHFYSTIPSVDDIHKNNLRNYETLTIKDIELNLEKQSTLLHDLFPFYNKIPYDFINDSSNIQFRYKLKDAQYRYSDVIFLFGIIQKFKPKRIIEVGSGYSSAVMLDTNELFFENSIDLTFIEPYPENRLNGLLKETDKNNIQLIKNFVQNVELEIYKSLEKNDILFIDSSHVSKLGSDLNHIMFEILPILKEGVIIHFHDVFYPFELPKKWINERKWYWNENYILRAFLMNNSKYEILAFNSFLHLKKKEWFEKEMPNCLLGCDETGSIWIQKK